MNSNKHILKGLLATALGIMMLTGCQDDELAPKPGEGSKGELIEINATLPGEEPQTRTIMGDFKDGIYPVLWSDVERIGLSNGSTISPFTLQSGTGTKYGRFTGSASNVVTGTSYYAACYPFTDGKIKVEGNELVVGGIIPTLQKYRNNSFDNDVYPMAAVSSMNDDFEFRNLAGVLQLNVTSKTGGTIKKIILTGNDGEDIAGGIAMHYNKENGEAISITNSWSSYKLSNYNPKGMITVDLGENGMTLTSAVTTFNIVVIPQTFEKGFTLRFIADNGGTFEKSTTQSITIKRSYTRVMANFDYETPEALETANCYIVSDAGYYMIPAFCMGNRQSVRLYSPKEGTPAKGPDGNVLPDDTDLAAAVLWTDVEDNNFSGDDALTKVVSEVEFISSNDGKGNISFKLNKDASGKPYRGNVVVCLYDTKKAKGDNILWSWHLWLTEKPEEKYTGGICQGGNYSTDGYDFIADPAKGKLTIMDRNLGAISANKADKLLTYGLYYQMGRKDPFIGANKVGSYSDRNSLTTIGGSDDLTSIKEWESTAFGDATHPSVYNKDLVVNYSDNPKGWKYLKDYLTVSRSIKEPMIFSSGSSYYWVQAKTAVNSLYVDSENFASGLNNTSFQAYWNRTKTIFDPCPAGWTVLGNYGLLIGSGDNKNLQRTDGLESVYGGVTTWWPPAGMRSSNGKMTELGYRGSYFMFDHIDNSHGGHSMSYYIKSGSITLDRWATTAAQSGGVRTNHASSIRCVKAKQP